MAIRIGLGLHLGMAGVGLPPPAAPVISAPVSTGGNSILLAGVATTVSGTCEAGCSVDVYWNAVLLGAAVVVGTNWTYSWTPSSGQEGVFDLTAVATRTSDLQVSVASTAKTPLVLADASLRVRANDPTSYTRTGSALDSLINQRTGASYAAKISNPGWTADDAGSGKPGFTFDGASALGGTEAAMLSVLGGSEKAFACFIVQRSASADPASNYTWLSAALSSSAGQQQTSFGLSNAGSGFFFFFRINTTARTWDSEASATGRQIVEYRSTDGLTVFCRKNGGTESSETLTAIGANSPDRIAFGCTYASTPTFFFTGTLFEVLHINAHKSAAIMTAIRDRLTADWI